MTQSLSDRRVQRTKLYLRHALMALMLEKPYEKITVQEIIDRANVGRATFYNHYADKDDLLLRGVAELAHHDTTAPPRATLNSHSLLPTAHMFRHSHQNKELHQIMFKRNLENPILTRVTAFLYKSIEQQLEQLKPSTQNPNVPTAIMAQFITGGLLALIQWWHDHATSYTPEEMDAFFQQMMQPGIMQVLQAKSE